MVRDPAHFDTVSKRGDIDDREKSYPTLKQRFIQREQPTYDFVEDSQVYLASENQKFVNKEEPAHGYVEDEQIYVA